MTNGIMTKRKNRVFDKWQPYSIPKTVLSNRLAFLLIGGEVILGIAGFMLLEHYNLREAFYMTVITIATVGYTEVRPLSAEGQMFTSVLIILNIGIFAYVLSVFTYYVINGEIFKKMHLDHIEKKITQLNTHVIVCGFGRYGREVAIHFVHHKTPFVVVENDPGIIEEIQKNEERILYIQDDATHDEALHRAGITRAIALITALPDDSDNLFVVLTARQLNPKLNIISRATAVKSQKKLRLAGANHVIMPEQIGGFYMATLVSKPGATEFFSFITRESESDIEFEELSFQNMPAVCRNKSIKDLHIRRETGANIIGFKQPNGRYIVNPGPETMLVENSGFIILGNREQLNALRQYLKKLEGSTGLSS
jgi:voltage-gated potassium channel